MKNKYWLLIMIPVVSCAAPKINETADNKTGENGKEKEGIRSQIDALDQKLAMLETGDTDKLPEFLAEQDTAFIIESVRNAYLAKSGKIVDEWIGALSGNYKDNGTSETPGWIALPDQIGYADGMFYFVGVAEGMLEMTASERSMANARVRICRYLSEELAPRFAGTDTAIYQTVLSFRKSMTLTGTAMRERYMEHKKSGLKYYSLVQMNSALVKENVLSNLIPAVDRLVDGGLDNLKGQIQQSDTEYIKNKLRIRYLEQKIKYLEKMRFPSK